jgi:hypothetical protein
MKTFSKTIATAVIAASALLSLAGCSQSQEAAPAPASQQVTDDRTAPKAVETIKAFFASATTEKIATTDPAAAGPELFDEALKLVDKEAEAEPLTSALQDLAVLKVGHPSSELTIEVNESGVVLDGDKASVPADQISIKSAGEKVANSDALAGRINDLVFRDGAWVMSFPSAAK